MNQTVRKNPDRFKLTRAFLSVLLVLTLVLSAAMPNGLGAWKAYADDEPEYVVPDHNKTRVSNGDGTYQLSLDITGDADTESTDAKANILIVFDVSGSMTNSDSIIYTYTATTGTSGTQYGYYNGQYVQLTYYNGTWYRQNNYGGWSQYNGTRYTRTQTRRGDAAEKVAYDFADALYEYNKTADADNVEMALICFSSERNNAQGGRYYGSVSGNAGNSTTAAWLVQDWTNSETTYLSNFSSTGTEGSRKLRYGGGTNWEAAMQAAVTALGSADGDPTYVVFITDGKPTFYVTGGNGRDTTWREYRGPEEEVLQISNYNTADHTYTNPDNSNTTLYGIYAYGNEADYLDDLIYYANTGTRRPGGESDATTATDNYYNASDQAALNQAISEIFAAIVKTLGVGSVSITDGTTTNVETEQGVSHLLEVEEGTFDYFLTIPVQGNGPYTTTRKDLVNGQDYTITFTEQEDGSFTATWEDSTGTHEVTGIEGSVNLGKLRYHWTESNDLYKFAPPDARYDDDASAVKWDLSGLGTLLDGVTYSVTFNVYPSQETYDLIADLDNGVIEYDDLDDAIKQYLIQEDGGSYTLETNTNASLTYVDTREENPQPHTEDFTNPPRVATDVSEMDVTKVWFNDLDGRGKQEYPDGFTMDLTRDGTVCDNVTVKPEDWTDSVYISTGLMRVYTDDDDNITGIDVLDNGHDYTLVEPPEMEYRWELVVETIHPMIINGELVSLVQVLEDDIPDGMGTADFYTLAGVNFYRLKNGKVYKENGQGSHAAVSAYNERKSNLNITKVVDGEDAPKDEFFTFTITATDPNKADLWFSVVTDPENPDETLVKDLDTNATAEVKDGQNTGYYYFSSGDTITVKMQDGWNLRFTNLPTGTTYVVEETTTGMSTGLSFDSVNGDTPITVSELPDGAVDMGDGTYSYNGIIYTKNDNDTYTYTYTPTITEAKVEGEVVAPNGAYQVTYTNKYALTDIEITKVWIDNSDEAEARPDTEAFAEYLTLKGDGTVVTGYEPTIVDNGDNTYTITWTGLPRFTADGKNEVEYTVEESAIDNYSTIGSPASDHGTITNWNVPVDTNTTTFFKKTVTTANPTSSSTFGFTIAAVTDGAPMPESTTGSVSFNANETGSKPIDFGEILFTATGTYTYTITETTVPNGWTASGSPATVTVTVSGNAEDGFTAAVTGGEITNAYDSTGTATITVSKALAGAAWPEGETLTLTLAGGTDAPMPTTTTATLSAEGSVSFGPITYGLADAGKTYTYTISEDGFGTGWAGSGNVTATVTVTDNGNGTLSTSVSYNPTDAKITNTYEATGNATITVTKALAGAAWPTGKTLTLTLTGTGDAPMPTTTTATLTAAGNASFGPIAYDESDAGKTYTYTISEDGFGTGWTGSGDITATVTVTDNGDGTLATSVSFSPDDATITNTYEATGSATITVTKALAGAAWPTGKTLTFTLTGGTGAPMPTTVTGTLTAEGSVSFGPIAYDESNIGGTYTYTVSEDGFGAGWTASDNVTATVTITDNGDGTLSADVSYSPESATITNTYDASGTATLTVTKALAGAVWPTGKTLMLTLTGTGDAPMPTTTTKTLEAAGSTTFGPITYGLEDAGQTYTYTISEDGFGTGWTGSGDITATVTVTDNGDGTLTASVSYSPEDATITNTYEATGSAPISATKVLTGKDLTAGMFSFVLKDADGNVVQEGVTNAADGTITFDNLTFDQADIGETYTYTITEVNGGQRIDGITYDDLEITVTIVISDNGDGTLTASVSYSSDTEFNNTYTVDPVNITLGAGKKLEVLSGDNAPDVTELYTLTLKDAAGDEIDSQLNPDGDGTVADFEELTFTAPGTYIYTVTETGEVAGVTNDADAETGKTIVVTVVDNGDGTMTATATVGEEEQNYVIFTNSYSAEPVSVDPPVQKVIEGNEELYNKGNFTFTIECTEKPESVETAPMPANTVITNTGTYELESKQGWYEFGEITFTVPGTYTYVVTETGSAPGVTNDAEASKTITFTVTDNGEGALEVTPTTDEAAFVFTNVYKAEPIEKAVEVDKSLVGKKLTADDVFTFQLTDEEGTVLQTKTTTDETGHVVFDAYTYTEAGIYTYYITEVAGDDENITTWDDHTVTATVTVTDNWDGTFTATVSYSPDHIFVNEYTPDPTKARISVNKALTGRDLNAGEFTFTLTELISEEDDEEPVTKVDAEPEAVEEDAEAAEEEAEAAEEAEDAFEAEEAEAEAEEAEGEREPVVLTATNDAAGLVNFDEITYTEPGTYTYIITEDEGSLGGVTYDDSEIIVIVEVTYDEETGELHAEVIYPDDITFDNTYVPAATAAQFEVEKTLEGRDLAEGEFSFELKDEEGNVIQTKTNDAAGTVTFDEITYDEAGTYTYTISEVDNGLGGVTYDGDVITVTVTVTDDLNGQLVAEVKYDGETSFINTYKAEPTKAVIQANKSLTGRSLAEGEFSFSLLDADGNLVETVKNTAAGSVVFSAITYDEAGTYTYTITETIGSAGGVTYDSNTVKVTVTVVDDGEGNLIATVSYDGAAEFKNTYAAKGDITPEVTKVLTGRDLKAGEFTFTLTDSNGKVLDTQTNAADGKVTFTTLNYTEADAGKTYTYSITETAGTDKDITYDSHTETVTVKVEDNGDGTLTVTATYSGDQKFNNKYTEPPEEPKTGDTNNPTLWLTLAGASLAGIIAMLAGRRKFIRR